MSKQPSELKWKTRENAFSHTRDAEDCKFGGRIQYLATDSAANGRP